MILLEMPRHVRRADAVRRTAGWLGAFAALTVCGPPLVAAAAGPLVPPAAAHEPATRRTSPPPPVRDKLEQRLDALTKALALDSPQKAKLRQLLERQRAAVLRIWADSSLLPAERAPATKAVADRTADDIRAILSDEQKQKFNPPRPPPPPDSPPPDVSRWMELMRPKST